MHTHADLSLRGVARLVRRFELREPRDVEMKGLGSVSVREIHNTAMWRPMNSAEDRAVEGLQALQDANRYWPRGSAAAPPG
jgi:hypothetical protein